MAAQANMFDELSSKINKRQPQQSSLGAHNGSSSPGQIKSSPEPSSQPSLKPPVPKKPQPIERVASVPASKANVPQIKVHAAKEEDSSLGQDHVDASHGGKKGGFMKSLKKMFKRKKKGKFDTDQSQLAGQYKARSEPDLLSTRESKHEKVEQVLRLNTTDSALADVSLSAEGGPTSGQLDSARPGHRVVTADEEVEDPTKHEVLNNAPQKLPTSLGKLSITKKQQNGDRGDAPTGIEEPPENLHESKTDRKVSPLPLTAKPIVPKRPSDVGTSTYVMEYSDDFFTSSLIKTEVQSVSASESLSFEAVAAVHSSNDGQNVIAKDRIRVAPKDRRKPAKFQQRPMPGASVVDGQESQPASTHDEIDTCAPRLSSEITALNAGHRCVTEEEMEEKHSPEDKVLLARSEESRSQASSQVAIDVNLGEPSLHRSEEIASLEGSLSSTKQVVEAVPSSDPVIREGSSRGSTASDGSSSSSADDIHGTSFDSIRASSDSTSSLGSKVMGIFESRRPLSLSLGVLPKMNERLGVSYMDGLKKTKSVGTLDFNECIRFVVAGKPDKPDVFDQKGGLRRSTSDIEQPLQTSRTRSHMEAPLKRRSLDDIPGLLSFDVAATVNSVAAEHKNAAFVTEITISDRSVERKSVNHGEHRFEDAVSQVPGDSVSAIVKEDRTTMNGGYAITPVLAVEASFGSPISAIADVVADHTTSVAHDSSQPLEIGATPQISHPDHSHLVGQPCSEDGLDRPSREVSLAFAPDSGVKGNVIANSELGKVDEDPSSVSFPGALDVTSLPKHSNEDRSLFEVSHQSLTSIAATNEANNTNESAPIRDSSVAMEDFKKKNYPLSVKSEGVESSRYRSLSEIKPRPYVPPKPGRTPASKECESGTGLRSSSFEEELQQPVTRSYSLSSSGTALPSPSRKPFTRSGRGAGGLTSSSNEGASPDSDWLLLARSKQSSFDDNVDDQTNVKPSSMKRRTSSGAAKIESGAAEKCIVCGKMAYIFERFEVENKILHKSCSNCTTCSRPLLVGAMYIVEGVVYCIEHKP